MQRTHDPRRQSPRLPPRQQQPVAVFNLPRRQEPKDSTKEDGLAKAKDFAEDWYLGLRGKVRDGE